MMRAQQAVAAGGAQGYLPPEHFDQIFSAHGTIMIFFVAMPLVIGLMNFVIPLQLGIRDVAFPTLNSGQPVAHGVGHPADECVAVHRRVREDGLWVAYPPLAEPGSRLAVSVDYFGRVVAADLRRRHPADRNKFRHHHPEDAGAGHELHAHVFAFCWNALAVEPDTSSRRSWC